MGASTPCLVAGSVTTVSLSEPTKTEAPKYVTIQSRPGSCQPVDRSLARSRHRRRVCRRALRNRRRLRSRSRPFTYIQCFQRRKRYHCTPRDRHLARDHYRHLVTVGPRAQQARGGRLQGYPRLGAMARRGCGTWHHHCALHGWPVVKMDFLDRRVPDGGAFHRARPATEKGDHKGDAERAVPCRYSNIPRGVLCAFGHRRWYDCRSCDDGMRQAHPPGRGDGCRIRRPHCRTRSNRVCDTWAR